MASKQKRAVQPSTRVTRLQAKRAREAMEADHGSVQLNATSPLPNESNNAASHERRKRRKSMRHAKQTHSNEKKDSVVHEPQRMLSFEILTLIFSFLKPPHLRKVMEACPTMTPVIVQLPIWKEICKAAMLGEPSKRGKYSTYFGVVKRYENRFCNWCYRRVRPSGSSAALPVNMESEGGEAIPLCITCRLLYYRNHPEPEIDDDLGKITKTTAKTTYKLQDDDLACLSCDVLRNPYYASAAPMCLFEESQVIELARIVHGGDIGILAATCVRPDYLVSKVAKKSDQQQPASSQESNTDQPNTQSPSGSEATHTTSQVIN